MTEFDQHAKRLRSGTLQARRHDAWGWLIAGSVVAVFVVEATVGGAIYWFR